MTDRHTPATWIAAFLSTYTQLKTMTSAEAVEGILALTATVEGGHTSLSLDCETCPKLDACTRFGLTSATSGRQWWAIHTTKPRIIG